MSPLRIVLAVLASAPLSLFAVEIPDQLRCRFEGPGGALELRKVRLAGATRDAFSVERGAAVLATCPGGDGVFIASAGAVGGATSYRVEVERDGGWETVVEESAAKGADRWIDLRLPVAGDAPPVRRWRLTTPSGEEAAADGAALWGGLRFLPAPAGAERPPNIVLISLDTLGAKYLGSFGGREDASRSIDKFLEKSFSFRRAYATYPNTLVSHASLFSGLYPTSHGVYGGIRDSQVHFDTLATLLRKEGYLNVAFTENAFVSSDFGFDRDFDWYDDGPERGDSSFLGDARETFGRARGWLECYGADSPFLLFVHTYEVHSPYIVRDEESRRVADEVFAGADVESNAESSADMERLHNAGFDRLTPDEVRRLEALHFGEISYLDRQFAELIGAIEALPLARRTLVVVFADHGDEFDPFGKIGHGETLADEVLQVPLAFYLPGRVPAGQFSDPVSLVDVLPTILELLGKPADAAVDGRSLMPLIDGRVEKLPPRAVFAELQRAAGTCQELRLPHDCFIGRFVAYAGDDRFETSMIPNYRELNGGDESGDRSRVDAFQALLSAYVTGSPWQTKVPWRPQSVEADRASRQAIDDVTRQRLEALGYDF